MTKNEIRKKAKALIKDDCLREAIDLIESFLNQKKVDDKYFSDLLISISANLRNIEKMNLAGRISYNEYKTDRSKIVHGLLGLSEEIPHLVMGKIGGQEEFEQSKAVTNLAVAQGRQFNYLREEMIGSDKLLVELLKQLKEKENLITQNSKDQIELLNRQIDELKKRIIEEEIKYENLKIAYEKLNFDRNQLEELKQEIIHLKERIDTKQKHIEILVQQQIWSEQHLKEKSELIAQKDSIISMKDQHLSELTDQLKRTKRK